MNDRVDMKRRAQEQANIGNYWARKCVGLIDENDQMRKQITTARGSLLEAEQWVDSGYEAGQLICQALSQLGGEA